jgi:hypothetical protein
MKLIKQIVTTKFSLSLFETPTGEYQIVSQTTIVTFGELLKDLLTALLMFDIKLVDLEGN